MRGATPEAEWVLFKGGLKDLSPVGDDLVGAVEMDHFRSQQAQAAVAVLGVVPGEKVAAKLPSLLE